MFGFTIVAGLAVAILATVVIPPAYQRTSAIYGEQAVLASQVRVNNLYIQYTERLIEAIKTDPILTQRLLIQQRNFRRPGETTVTIAGAPEEVPIAQLLAATTTNPAPPQPTMAMLATRVQDPRTRRGLLLLAAVLLTVAMVLFAPPDDSKKPRRNCEL